MVFAWLTGNKRISWSFLSVLLSTRAVAAFPISRLSSNAIRTPIAFQVRFPGLTLGATKVSADKVSKTSAKPKSQANNVGRFPNAALDISLIPDTIGQSGVSKSVPAQINKPAPEGKVSAEALNHLLTPDTIGNSGIGKSIPIQLHFPEAEGRTLAEAILIPDTLESGGTGYSASLIPDTIGNSGISKSIPVQIHFPESEGKKSAEALLIPDTLLGEGGTGYSALLTPDTIGNSGIIKSVPVQIHYPDPEPRKSAEALLIPDTLLGGGGTGYSALLTPDTIGNSGISKSIPVQIHYPDPDTKVTAEAFLIPDTLGKSGAGFSALLAPDTIGNSGISKSVPFQIHFPDPETKVTAEAFLIPDTLGKSGAGFSALLAPDSIGNSGISKSVPVQIHFPTAEGRASAEALNEQLTPDTIGYSGIGKSVPIQIHSPASEGRVSAKPIDALLTPDTIGYSGISKSVPAEKKGFPAQRFSCLFISKKKPGPGKVTTRSVSTTTSSKSPAKPTSTKRQKQKQSTKMSNPTTWMEGKASAMAQCILPLSFDSHKGSSGRVGVLGGSAQYTGAPYYAAMASLKAGADLAYVFCAEEACLPIKSYSPELMVAPVYNAAAFDALSDDYEENAQAKQAVIGKMAEEVESKLERLHVLVIGPGLGRCPLVCEATAQIIKFAQTKKLAMVLDADALWMLAQPEYRNLFEGYTGAPVVLTPNVVEYKRLVNSLSPAQLQSTTIVKKGHTDVIVQDGKETMECRDVGGKKRSGGIGDVLAGTLGTLVAWNRILNKDITADATDFLALACWSACCFVKRATQLAFNDKKRSMTAPDVLDHLGPAINDMTGEEEVCGPTSDL